MDPTPYAGPLAVSIATIFVYYCFIIRILFTKQRLSAEYKERDENFDRYFGKDREMLAADRTQLNMLEHLTPFLALLWLNAVFVSTTWATVVGAIYVASRVAYPFVMGGHLGRGVRGSILISTLPGYLVIAAFAGALIVTLVSSGL